MLFRLPLYHVNPRIPKMCIRDSVYTQLGSTMPAAATAIMNFGIALSQYWYIFGILLVLIAAAFLTYRCVPSFKNRLSRLFSGRAVQKTIG